LPYQSLRPQKTLRLLNRIALDQTASYLGCKPL